jgi:putative ABC transport system permease protein
MDHPEVLKEDIKRIAGVMNVSVSGYLPTGGARWQNSISLPESEGLLSEFWSVDADYIPTLQMKMALGRNFSPDLATDTAAIILNRSAADKLGVGIMSLGKQIVTRGKKYQLIGVVDDFNYASLRDNIAPLALVLGGDWQASLVVRVAGNQSKGIVGEIDQLWKKVNPGYPFEYSFMDKDFEATYLSEQRMKSLFVIFSCLAIAIAGIGLFGLSAYAAEQRTHEMAVRKVLGASVASVFNLLSMSFLKLVAIAAVISLPVSWLVMDRWLSTFAFRIDIPLWILLSSAALILVVAGVAIMVQTLKAALQNPVDSLRLD